MIQIRNDAGQFLQLSAGQGITVEQASGWLSDDNLPGAFSYPITAPLNEHNERFLSYSWRPGHISPQMELPVNVNLAGMLYRRCTFSYRIRDAKIDGYLKIDGGEAFSKLKEKRLGEVLPAGIPMAGYPGQLKARLRQIAAMAPGSFPFTFFPVYNELMIEPEFGADKLPGFTRSSYINNWDRYDFVVDSAGKTGNLISPQFYLAWIVEQVLLAAGYRMQGDFFSRPEIRRLVVLNLTAMSVKTGFSSLFPDYVYPRYHVPDMTVSDFLKAVKTRFGLVFGFNSTEKTCTIRCFSDVWRERPDRDWRSFQKPDYGIEEASGSGYTIEEYLDPEDELYKVPDGKGGLTLSQPGTYVSGDGANRITMPVGTANITYLVTPYNQAAKWIVPVVRQPGNILDPAYQASARYVTDGQRKNSCGLRLLSYMGMQKDSAGSLYPLATSAVRDGTQAQISSFSPALSGRFGGWHGGLALYYYFLSNTRKVTADMLLPAQELAALKLHKPVMLWFDRQPGQFLPAKITAEAPGPSGLLKVRGEFQTVPAAISLGTESFPDPVWVEWTETRTQASRSQSGVVFVERRITITVKCWKERQRITPAAVQSLPLRVRKKVDYVVGSSQPDVETIQTYYGTGTQTVLENNTLADRLQSGSMLAGLQFYTTTYQLEPGDDYNII
ncbi:hypothetical protein [Arsenicibacter rosenii]|uniref:Uncharacterized protein n=1 Tax=Arsenicibacter rosenii TaxID=1750698 RepID=A0A1S2VM54_9BACT|nr:hypothetical protein [Arsenicibacter rosenii]OIN59829.1 hypothetical protein BLX24_08195 [Arsenicibacter rosenii]